MTNRVVLLGMACALAGALGPSVAWADDGPASVATRTGFGAGVIAFGMLVPLPIAAMLSAPVPVAFAPFLAPDLRGGGIRFAWEFP
jgi:hypothetical protein